MKTELLERKVQEDRRLLLLDHTSLIWKIACPTYFAFYFLDMTVTQGPTLRLFLYIRIAVFLLVTFLFLTLKTIWGKRNVEFVSAAIILAPIVGIEAMCPFIGGFSSSYYVGIMVTCFVVGAYLPWRLPTTLVFSILALLGYFVLNIWLAPATYLIELVEPSSFLAGTFFFLCFSSVAYDRKLRRDVSLRLELERVNRDLQEVAETKNRLFANVSHELRTPLTLILGPLQSLLRQSLSKDHRETLTTMLGNARRLLRQVNALLDLAKSESGRLHLKVEVGNLGSHAQQLVELALEHAHAQSITIETVDLNTIPDTQFDFEKIEIIVMNLLSNAIKFTPQGGHILVRGDFAKDTIILEIEDNGPGVPENLRDQVFERFFQVDGTKRRATDGTGIGLSLSRQLARLHGGDIVCQSAPKGGALFRLTIPEVIPALEERRKKYRRREDRLAALYLDSVASRAMELQQQRMATLLADLSCGLENSVEKFGIIGPTTAPLVLVVEDNPDLLRFLSNSLVDEYRVLQASDGVEGLELATRHRPQVVVSDVMMPRMDGYTLCRELRKSEKEPPIILLVTARTGVEAVVEGLEVGADDYLTKPFQVEELKARIAAHLRSRFLERQSSERESRLVAIGSMTSSIIHDLRNPLSVVVTLKELALEQVSQEKADETKELREVLEDIGEAASRIQAMLEELLEFARTGTQKILKSPTNFRCFLERFAENQRLILSDHQIDLLLQFDLPENCIAEFDAPRLERVFENLINNAREVLLSTVESGQRRIRITARMEKEIITVGVSDSGPGIANEIIDTLFEPFATRGKSGGTGLGLATARNWILAHNGRIDVEASGPDGGAYFNVILPVVLPDYSKESRLRVAAGM